MASNSLWYQAVKGNFPQLDKKIKADVLVIGGGITGLSTAYYLFKAGLDVVLLEASEIGRGVTGHTTAHITSQHGLAYKYWVKRFGKGKTRLFAQTNEEAIREIHKIVTEEKIECDFSFVDSCLFTNQNYNVKHIEEECHVAKQMGIQAEMMRRGNFAVPYLAAVAFKNQAQFQPLSYLYGLAEALRRKNARIFEQSRVLHIEGNKAVTQEGIVIADNIVVATHFPIVNFPGWYFARGYQDRSYCMAFENAPTVTGMWNSLDGEGLTYRMFGNLLVISGLNHRCGTQKHIDHYQKLLDEVNKNLPGLKPVYRWSAQDVMTLDDFPYIGKYSKDSKNLFVATGFRKWGMTQSNIAARVLRDVITGVKSPSLRVTSPQRKCTPYAVAHGICINAVTAGHLLGGLLRFGPPLCAHMKCRLKWNPDENTWDCPCHGSRFEENGSVLNTPAIHDLKRPDKA